MVWSRLYTLTVLYSRYFLTCLATVILYLLYSEACTVTFHCNKYNSWLDCVRHFDISLTGILIYVMQAKPLR